MPATTPPQTTWLFRISPVFSDLAPEIFAALGVAPLRKLGRDFHLVKTSGPLSPQDSAASIFVSWKLPVHHAWPCVPRETPGFVEKASQAMVRKFATAHPQTIITGALDPSERDRYHKTLASNLRGRALQLFGGSAASIRDAAEQNPNAPTLFALVGREGLFCGLASPRDSNGFYAGGTKFIRQNRPETVSRAGAKIAEALHYLRLHRPLPPAGTHWLELGASPGGMTAELLARGYRVNAVDRAPLDPRLDGKPGLRFIVADAGNFAPRDRGAFDAILSDLNGDPLPAMSSVARLSKHLAPGGLVVFTIKLPGVADFSGILETVRQTRQMAAEAGLRALAITHLTYNRHELTMLLEPAPQSLVNL